MRLFGYYAVHTFINSIRKLFRSWVLALILCIALFGGAVGVVAGIITETVAPEEPPVSVEEGVEEAPVEVDPKELLEIVELIAGGVVLLVLLANFYGGDKTGTQIFNMADVNILFPSPRPPQSVLLFKTVLQMGTVLAGSIYLVFQMPNLILNMGLSPLMAVFILLAWVEMMMVGKLISVCVYTVSATWPKMRKLVVPATAGIVLLIGLAFFAFGTLSGGEKMNWYAAAKSFFNAPASRWIPLWGSIKGGLMFAIEGEWLQAVGCLAETVAVCVLGGYLIWRIRADFYEDALAGASAVQEKLDAAAEGRRMKTRRREYKETEIGRGCGANIFFFKSLYNRFRFAQLRVLTKTGITALLVAVGAAVLTRLSGGHSPVGFSLALLAIAFFRSYADPLMGEDDLPYLRLVPEKAAKKLFWSYMAGRADTVLDMIPAFIIATAVAGAPVGESALWLVLLVCFDAICAAAGIMLLMIIPSYINPAIRGLLLLMLKFFAIVPTAVLLVAGVLLDSFMPMLAVAAGINLLSGVVMVLISAACLHEGNA